MRQVADHPEQATQARCPFEHFDPLAPDQLDDPYPLLMEAQRDQPVFFMEKYGMWCVTRYEDARAIFSDPDTYRNAGKHNVAIPRSAIESGIVPEEYEFPMAGPHLPNSDPPRHTRQRKLFAKGLSPQHVNQHESEIRELANQLIDEFEADGHTDLAQTYSTPLPTITIARVLGMPVERALEFNTCASDYFRMWGGGADVPEDEQRERFGHLVALEEWLGSFTQSRREHPQDDLTSRLAQTSSEDGILDERELNTNIFMLVLGASDTTVGLITHSIYLLQRHREWWERIVEDPELIPGALEESLRLMGPLRGTMRIVAKDVELGGVTIPKGDRIFVHHAVAHREDEVFADADRFDPTRSNVKRHLALGLGTHFCIGAPLARLEGRVALEVLTQRLPQLRLRDDGPLSRTVSFMTPIIRSLPATWD